MCRNIIRLTVTYPGNESFSVVTLRISQCRESKHVMCDPFITDWRLLQASADGGSDMQLWNRLSKQ